VGAIVRALTIRAVGVSPKTLPASPDAGVELLDPGFAIARALGRCARSGLCGIVAGLERQPCQPDSQVIAPRYLLQGGTMWFIRAYAIS
jgi:hypothetical protein